MLKTFVRNIIFNNPIQACSLKNKCLVKIQSFFFEQFIRTLVCKRKLYHFGHSESVKSLKYKTDSTSKHALMYCYIPKYFVHSLAIFLDQYYKNHNPEF